MSPCIFWTIWGERRFGLKTTGWGTASCCTSTTGNVYEKAVYWSRDAFLLYRLKLPDPYVGAGGVDFICSKPGHEGMTHCASEIPIWIENGVPCNGSYPSSVGGPTAASSCVNWNQYYTVSSTLRTLPRMNQESSLDHLCNIYVPCTVYHSLCTLGTMECRPM